MFILIALLVTHGQGALRLASNLRKLARSGYFSRAHLDLGIYVLPA